MQMFIIAVGAVPTLFSLAVYPSVSFKAALCLLGSGASCGFYYVSLGRGYRAADFTTVYPAARALPVLIVGIADAFRGRAPSPVGWVGLFLVSAGCFLSPLNSFADFRLRHYWKPASAWILFAAMGTVGYSVFDKIGAEAIPRGSRETAVYCYLFFAATAVSYIPLQALPGNRGRREPEVGWRIPAIAGTLCFLAYWLVLCAYQMLERASYVVAFRQFSIVIGVVVAFVLFDEPGKIVRITGSIVITIGLILLKVFGEQ